jgi:hypothetical protein
VDGTKSAVEGRKKSHTRKKIYNILKILLLTDLSHWGMFAGDKFDSAKLSYT